MTASHLLAREEAESSYYPCRSSLSGEETFHPLGKLGEALGYFWFNNDLCATGIYCLRPSQYCAVRERVLHNQEKPYLKCH